MVRRGGVLFEAEGVLIKNTAIGGRFGARRHDICM